MNKTGILITYAIKGDRINKDHLGFPYKLEYSMVKREWYLLWYHTRHHSLMSTRLKKIQSVTSEPIEPSAAKNILRKIGKTLESRKTEVIIEIVRVYNAELSRILYAFSSFEKNVEYDTEKDTYRVRVSLLGDELEYLLSKIRFLGKRVWVVEGDYLKKRMLESSSKALERYGIIPTDEELSS
jgi:predicted DNA-binding transcriptional regulator YafY